MKKCILLILLVICPVFASFEIELNENYISIIRAVIANEKILQQIQLNLRNNFIWDNDNILEKKEGYYQVQLIFKKINHETVTNFRILKINYNKKSNKISNFFY